MFKNKIQDDKGHRELRSEEEKPKAVRLLEGPPSPFPHCVKHDAHSHDSLTSGRGKSHFVSLLNSRERHTIHLREHNTK